MNRQTILDTEYATLWHYPDDKVVHHVFHKFIYGEEFRQVLTRGLEIFKEQKANKWLSDDRKNSTLPADDSEWAINTWSPQVTAAGWKYWAIVMPDKVIGKLNMQRFIKMYKDLGVTVEIFDDSDEALKWLMTVETAAPQSADNP